MLELDQEHMDVEFHKKIIELGIMTQQQIDKFIEKCNDIREEIEAKFTSLNITIYNVGVHVKGEPISITDYQKEELLREFKDSPISFNIVDNTFYLNGFILFYDGSTPYVYFMSSFIANRCVEEFKSDQDFKNMETTTSSVN